MASQMGKFPDLRPWVLAAVAAVSPTDPTAALRTGALLCAGLFLSAVWNWRPSVPDFLATALTILAVFSLTWAESPANTAVSATNQVAVLCIFLCTRSVVRNGYGRSVIAFGYVLGCLYAVYLVLTENSIASVGPELSDVRYGVSGLNLNYLAYSLMTGVVVSFLLWRHKRLRFAVVLAITAMAGCVWLAGSRGAVLAGLCIAAWLLICRWKPARALRILGLVVLFSATAVTTGFADSFLRQIEGATARATGDLAGRLTTWPIARKIFEQNPFVGVGAGGFAGLNPYGIGAHAVTLEVGTGLGLIGLSLFVATVYTALISCTSAVEARRRCLLIGSMVVCWTPIYLSGHWELSPAAWIVMGLFSRLDATPGPARRQYSSGHREPGGQASSINRRQVPRTEKMSDRLDVSPQRIAPLWVVAGTISTRRVWATNDRRLER